jgi:hypothetical protein
MSTCLYANIQLVKEGDLFVQTNFNSAPTAKPAVEVLAVDSSKLKKAVQTRFCMISEWKPSSALCRPHAVNGRRL